MTSRENSDSDIELALVHKSQDLIQDYLCGNKPKRWKYFNAFIGAVPSDSLTNFRRIVRDFSFDFLSAVAEGTFLLSFFCIILPTSIVFSEFTPSPFLLLKSVERETRNSLGVYSLNGCMSSNQLLIAFMAFSFANLCAFARSL